MAGSQVGSRVLCALSVKCATTCCRHMSSKQHCRHLLMKNNCLLKKLFIPSKTAIRNLQTNIALRGKIVPFLLSDIGEGIREVSLKEWYVEEGDRVAQFDSICEVQSDKASVTITSRYDGVISRRHHDIDGIALVGQPLVDIQLDDGDYDSMEKGQVDQADVPLATSEPAVLADSRMKDKALATPAVRRVALENEIQLSDVTGTGKEGRILKDDIIAYLVKLEGEGTAPLQSVQSEWSAPPLATPTAPATPPPPPVPARTAGEGDRVEAIKGVRKAMLKIMTEAQSIPHFGYCDEVDVTELHALRLLLRSSAEQRGVRFSYMPVFIKAASLALNRFPILNASIDANCENIIYKVAHNIGFALDTPAGLMVPNIKGVEKLSVFETAAEITRLSDLGRLGKLGTADLSGGTFSLSNIGSIGGTYAKPVLMPPEVAIGALGKIQALPRYGASGDLVKRYVMQVSWSADHRVIDGATMAHFSNMWKAYLESPGTMILDLR